VFLLSELELEFEELESSLDDEVAFTGVVKVPVAILAAPYVKVNS
jgi:hypothetical protein